MPTVKVEVVAGAQTVTLTKTVSADHLTRFVAAIKRAFSLGAVTDAQAITRWGEEVFADAKALVKEQERAARFDPVPEIDFT